MFALLSAALAACSVPAPFMHRPVTSTPQPTPEPAPVVDASTPEPPRPVVQPAQRVNGPDLWQRVSEQLALHLDPQHAPTNPLAQLQFGKSFIERATAESEPFLFYVLGELDKRELPYELALVPLIESSYNPGAGAARGPAGLWQLIPSTGQRFGLTQTRWYDGRRDVVASTEAALDYFEQLRDRFEGDWLLALAAYNCGERTVMDAIARNRHRGRRVDYWSLSLPGHTRQYVNRLLAVSAVLANPRAHGVQPARIPDRPYFDVVDVGRNLPLTRIAAASGLGPERFRKLNPAYAQQVTVDGATRVLIAHGHAEDVTLALASIGDDVRRLPVASLAAGDGAPRREHVVRAGESLSLIAARRGVTVKALRAANHLSSTQLRIGQVLRLPQAGGESKLASAPSLVKRSSASRAAQHVVQGGDNLWDIARRYHSSPEALAEANGLTPRSVLKLGQRLRLPPRDRVEPNTDAGGSKVALAEEEAQYQVRQGDSLWTISRRFKVSVDALKKWNRLPAGTPALQPGQRLVVNGET
ncbi:MAG: LysM peptidoglycan-binding domain-containing protein [Gammaproteobacteria bacterium]